MIEHYVYLLLPQNEKHTIDRCKKTIAVCNWIKRLAFAALIITAMLAVSGLAKVPFPGMSSIGIMLIIVIILFATRFIANERIKDTYSQHLPHEATKVFSIRDLATDEHGASLMKGFRMHIHLLTEYIELFWNSKLPDVYFLQVSAPSWEDYRPTKVVGYILFREDLDPELVQWDRHGITISYGRASSAQQAILKLICDHMLNTPDRRERAQCAAGATV